MRKRMEYIAEIGWNFMGDVDLAEKMISAASASGATTCKFQYWNPEKLKKGAWDEDGRRQIYEKAKLSEEKILQLAELCEANNIKFLMSVFNCEDLQFVTKFSKRAIKIPSHEVANLELIDMALCEMKEVHLSLGACSKEELMEVADLVDKRRPNDANVTAMHCVSSYPCEDKNINLPRLDFIKELFNCSLGLSDHTTSAIVPALAVVKGVSVIEKHFTVDRDLPGRDNKFAMLPNMFKEMVNNCASANNSLVDHGVEAQESEKDTIENYRGRWG